MVADISISEVVLSIGQEIVMNVVSGIYKDKTLAYKIEKEFKKAILASVNAVLPYEHDKDIMNAIAEDIFYFLTKMDIDKADLVGIVENTLAQYEDENKDSKLLAKGIVAELPMQIFKFKELNVLANTKLAFGLIEKNKELLIELDILKNHVMLSRCDNQVIRELIMQLMEMNRNLVLNQRKMQFNNKFIPDKYKMYFFNKLFLEENLGDNRIARLKDVYIKPRFTIMDFKASDDKIGTDIIRFIEDFVGVEKKNKKYNPYFDFYNKHITTLFIKGHPGSGKSSLFYYLAYIKSHEAEFLTDYKMYFVKLIELYKENNNVLSENNPLDDLLKHLNIESADFNDTVLVLDGLDEICAAKNINIYEYCSNLVDSTFRYTNFKIIITTRLNYINIKNSDNKNVLNIQLNNWEISDLNEWIKGYFCVHKESTDLLRIAHENIEYLSQNDNTEMLAILAVPLIFYMITAIGLKLCNFESIGQLYDKVFEELYTRNYNENNNSALQKCGIIKAIPRKVSRQIAMEIAFKMYEENELLLKVNSIELAQAINNALNSSENVEVDTLHKRQIEKLFPITFFYKEVYDVVEFAHKSIMEFFCAEKIFHDFILTNNQEVTSFILKNMVERPITVEIMRFFIYFYETRYEKVYNNKQAILIEFEKIIQNGEEWNTITKKAYGFEISKLVFKIFWVLIKDILKCKPDDINPILSNTYMKSYMIGVLHIRNSNNIQFINNDVYRLNFRECTFETYSFNYTDLRYSDFTGATFIKCSLTNSDLQMCTFSRIIIREFMDFSYSNLCSSVFDGINENNKIYMKCIRVGNTIIKNSDIRSWVFSNVIYTDEFKMLNVTLTAEQYKILLNEYTLFDDVTILLKPDIITTKDVSEAKKMYRENKGNWDELLDTYIKNIISNWEFKNVLNCSNVKKYHLSYDIALFKLHINEKVQRDYRKVGRRDFKRL